MATRLFVGGIPFATTEEELTAFFNQVGTVVGVQIVKDRMTNRSRGFGFVEYGTEEEANEAVAKLNGVELGGRKLAVSTARPRDSQPRDMRPRQ